MKTFLLSVGLIATTVYAQAQCSDLMISKYCSMGANNKAIEIYNPTSSPINMTAGGYFLARYKTPTSSGNTSGTVPTFPNFDDTVHLKGIIPAYGTWVITNPETTPSSSNSNAICNPYLQGKANQLSNIYGTYGTTVGDPIYFKGSDAITIEKKSGASSVIVDMFGRFGDYMAASNGKPSAWSTTSPYTGGTGMGTWITKGYMLVRKSSVQKGITSNPSAFNPLLEYDTIARPKSHADTLAIWDLLGSHKSICNPNSVQSFDNSVISIVFPNPVSANNKLTIQSSESIRSYSIYSIDGRLLIQKEISGKENQVEIKTDNIKNGIYIVKLLHPTGNYSTTRFTKE